MQFIDSSGILSGGSVDVVRAGNRVVATVKLDSLGICPDDILGQYERPFTLRIKDSTGRVVFQIALGF